MPDFGLDKNAIRTLLGLSVSSEVVGDVDTQTLINKTVDVLLNTLKQTTPAVGAILKDNGTKFVPLARGTANQVLAVNSSGTDLVWSTISTGGGNVSTTQSNTYGDFDQIFRYGRIKTRNSANTFDHSIQSLSTAARTWSLPDVSDTAVGKATTDTLTNKTLDVQGTGNSLKQTTPATGAILRDNGTSFVPLARGSANQVLTVNAGGTDIAWAAAASGGGNVSTGQSNTYGDFDQIFRSGRLDLTNPANTFNYSLVGSAITAARNITLPLLTADDTLTAIAATQTLTNKTMDSPLNTIKNSPTASKYVIFKDASDNNYKLLNSVTGTIDSSSSTPDSVVQAALTAGGDIYIKGGNYPVSGSFAGWNVAQSFCKLTLAADATIQVPAAYAGYVFKIGDGVSNSIIDGGKILELGTPSRLWTAFKLQSTSSAAGGVGFNFIKNTYVVNPNRAIWLLVDGSTGYVNGNTFSDLTIWNPNIFIDFDITVTYSANVNGFQRNHFRNIDGESGTNTTYGAKNVRHISNTFFNVNFWDLPAAAVSASIHADSTHTIIIGGIMTNSNFSDSGTDTKILDEFQPFKIGSDIQLSAVKSIKYLTQTLMTPIPGGGINFNDNYLTNLDPANGGLKFYDSNTTYWYTVVTSALTANRNITLPVLTANDTFVFQATTDTLTNKTIDVQGTGNSLKQTTPAAGAILKDNGTKFVPLARGTANQVLAVNSGGTDVAYASLDQERTGKATASGNGSTTVFNITHGLGSTPTYAFVDCSSHAIARTFTVSSTTIAVTFASAPSSGTNNVIIYWRVLA